MMRVVVAKKNPKYGFMSEERVRHLPVFEGKKPIGIVSIGDLVKSIIGDQKFVIVQLEQYIHGERAVVDG